MPSLDDLVDGVREVLVTLQGIDLWPPWDAAQEIVDAVARVVEIAAHPPEPDPERLRDAARAWRRAGDAWRIATDDLERAEPLLAAPQVWEGSAGDGARVSLHRLAARMDTAGPACRGAETALTEAADSMADARARHAAAYPTLRSHLSITWSDLWPWELVDTLRGILEAVVAATQELVGAYADAAACLRRAGSAIEAAVDGIDLPADLVDGVSAVDQVNAAGEGTGATDDGPLRGSVAERAQARLAALSPADRAAVQGMLAGAPDDEARGWILAALASGVSLTVLQRFTDRLVTMTPEQRRLLDPRLQADGVYRQPDGTTCGSSSLVYARMLNDPAYAMAVLTGYDPRTDTTSGTSAVDRFATESQRMHDQTNGLTDHDGDVNGWWPQQAGTSPGSAARQMSGGDGLSGVPGSSYDVHYIAPSNLAASYDRMVASANEGHVVPLYVGEVGGPHGSGFHVVLVTGATGDDLRVYEPGSGRVVTITRQQFVDQQLHAAGLGWDLPMATVVP